MYCILQVLEGKIINTAMSEGMRLIVEFLAVPMMALHIPEEQRCLDILELTEHKDLLK